MAAGAALAVVALVAWLAGPGSDDGGGAPGAGAAPTTTTTIAPHDHGPTAVLADADHHGAASQDLIATLEAEGYRRAGPAQDIMWEYHGERPESALSGDELVAAAHATAEERGWSDRAGAERDGFAPLSPVADELHLFHRGYLDDGVVGDPSRPESLVYDLETGRLLAVMLMVPLGEHGPAIGGYPEARWHVHAVRMCFGADGMLPLGYADEGCAPGQVRGRWTSEMIHIWFDGAPFDAGMGDR